MWRPRISKICETKEEERCAEGVMAEKVPPQNAIVERCVICGSILPTESGKQYCKKCEEEYL